MAGQAISHCTVEMPEKDKRLIHWDGGHARPRYPSVIKEALAWFDRYLGSVK